MLRAPSQPLRKFDALSEVANSNAIIFFPAIANSMRVKTHAAMYPLEGKDMSVTDIRATLLIVQFLFEGPHRCGDRPLLRE
jgi:hypothetical protein